MQLYREKYKFATIYIHVVLLLAKVAKVNPFGTLVFFTVYRITNVISGEDFKGAISTKYKINNYDPLMKGTCK